MFIKTFKRNINFYQRMKEIIKKNMNIARKDSSYSEERESTFHEFFKKRSFKRSSY